jgi:cyanophycin synthetase
MTSKTSALAVDIASDKDLTAKLLGSAGLPVPKQEVVRTEAARSRSPARSASPSSSNRSTATTAAASG